MEQEWPLNVIDQLKVKFGQEFHLVTQDGGVQVYHWPDLQCQNKGLLCTAGMSNRVQAAEQAHSPSVEPRTELICFCLLSDAGVLAHLLIDLARYPFEHDTCLHWWHSLSLGFPIVPNSHLSAILFTFPPFNAETNTFIINDYRVDLLWAIPITQAELRFCHDHGAQALEDLLLSSGANLADLNRNSIVP